MTPSEEMNNQIVTLERNPLPFLSSSPSLPHGLGAVLQSELLLGTPAAAPKGLSIPHLQIFTSGGHVVG